MRGQLLLSWSELVWSSSGYHSMSVVSASFWHAVGTGHAWGTPLNANFGRTLPRPRLVALILVGLGAEVGCQLTSL